MATITVQEIQHDPRSFVRRLQAGEELVVLEGERALAQVQPLAPGGYKAHPRPYGLCAGQFTVPADFDQALPEEILQEFEGR
jgi:antitoxin (DNA-binding transcriptional repressor) of toxin-antitoxin stability system